MKIEVEQVDGEVSVTIMKLIGELDAVSYTDVIDKAKELKTEGMKNLLLDLGEMGFMSSSGLVALHSIAMLLRGDANSDSEGWGTMRTISQDIQKDSSYEASCKLLNPQSRVEKTLNITGFNRILETFMDKSAAIASFG